MNTLSRHSNGPVSAVWNDGKSAASHTVSLFFRPHQAEIRICAAGCLNDTQPLAVWNAHSIRVLSGKLSEASPSPLRLAEEPDSGQRLTVEGRESLSALVRWMRGPQAERRARTRRRWLTGTLAVWAVFIGLYLSSPILFSFAARLIPQSWEERLGETALDNIVDTLLYLPGVREINEEAGDDPNLDALLTRLEEGAPARGYIFEVLVLDADFVNAFAVPGGYMLVSTGLIKACATPDEFAGVLAHEMAHVTERHGTGRMLREQAWAFFIRLMSGSDGLAAKIAGSVVTSSFDRDDEREADAKGVFRLVGAGIDPMGLADFFARLEKQEKEGKEETGTTDRLLSYVASHPQLAERRNNIERDMRRAREQGAPPVSPAMTEEEWRQFRAVCGIHPDRTRETTPPKGTKDSGTQTTPPDAAPPSEPLPAPGPDNDRPGSNDQDAPAPRDMRVPQESGLESVALVTAAPLPQCRVQARYAWQKLNRPASGTISQSPLHQCLPRPQCRVQVRYARQGLNRLVPQGKIAHCPSCQCLPGPGGCGRSPHLSQIGFDSSKKTASQPHDRPDA